MEEPEDIDMPACTSDFLKYYMYLYIGVYIYIYIYALRHSVSLDHYVSDDLERKERLNMSGYIL